MLRWLEYDPVALAIYLAGISMISLLATSM
jgi:hypothetical protein